VELRFTKAARKHKIGRAHVLYVIGSVEPTADKTERGESAIRWIGCDETGRELNVLAVEQPDRKTGEPIILIIHVQPNYRDLKGEWEG